MNNVQKPSTDRIIIRDLNIETIIGLYPWEQVARQNLLLDIDLTTDIRRAAANDDLEYAVDYSAVCSQVTALAHHGGFKLIETLAERIATMILQEFSVSWVRVAVYKLDVMTQVKRVGIEIERSGSP
jgi:dihydroneopterin aldolase